MENLENQLAEIESFFSKQELIDSNISSASIGWHMEHSLLVIDGIIYSLSKSIPENYKPTFNWSKQFIFLRKQIPRGKARAPKSVVPTNFDSEHLLKHIQKTKEYIKRLANQKPGQFFNHPGLGALTLKDTVKFLQIHTHHHLQIMREILRNKQSH